MTGHASTSREAEGKPPRYRCTVCGQYPLITKEGTLRNHTYPWFHSQSGDPCPGGGCQVRPLEGQQALDLSDQGESSQ